MSAMKKLNEPSSCLKSVACGVHTEERLRAVQDRCWAVCWHHSGRLLASCGEDRTVKLWRCDVADGDGNARLEMVFPLRGDQTRSVRSVAFSPCGRFLASASFDSSIVVYERQQTEENGDFVVEFEEVHRLEGHENEVKCVAFSRSGEYLATCSRDKSVWVWQVDDDNDYEVASILQHHTADVKFVAWHPREDLLVSTGYDCSIRFYTFDGDDWSTSQAIKDAHEETVWSAAFEPTAGAHLASVGGDQTVRIWRCTMPSAKEENGWQKMAEHTIMDTRWPLYTVAWSASVQPIAASGIIAVGGGDCSVRLFTLDTELEVLTLLGAVRMGSEVNCVAWRPKEEDQEQLLKNTNNSIGRATPSYLAVALDSGELHLLNLKLDSKQTEE